MKLVSFAAVAIALVPLATAHAAKRCLKMEDHSATAPIALSGRLAVTYVDQSIDETKGDQHEVGVFDFAPPEAERKVRLLTRNALNESEVEIAPDGNSLLFTSRNKLDNFVDSSEIWQINMDGTNPRRLLAEKPIGVPAWHQPGSEIFTYIQWGGESNDSRLYTYDAATRGVTPFPTAQTGQADPEVSYDGKLFTFKMSVRGDRAQQPSIYVMNSDGTNQRRLTGLTKKSQFSDHDPVFSADGKKIYFERYYGPGDWFYASQHRGDNPKFNMWGIVEVDVATRQEKVIVPHDPCGKHFFWLPTVSPDGKSLMYVHIDVWGKIWTDLWVAEIDGKNPQKVKGSDMFYFFDWAK